MGLETNGAAVSYTKAEALLICWKHGGKTQETFKDQRDKLGHELEGYNFGVETFEIESVKPYRTLFQRLHEFLRHDDRETLLVVYYGGHGEKNEDNQLVWLRLVHLTPPCSTVPAGSNTSYFLGAISRSHPETSEGSHKSTGALYRRSSYTNALHRSSSCSTAATPERRYIASKVPAQSWPSPPRASTTWPPCAERTASQPFSPRR
jgi:hypothetical protein